MLKIALIGCGLVADQHAAQIRRIPNCQLAGVCDTEILMARQLAERFHVERSYTDARAMLCELRPDVVHVTTPAQSHFPLGQLCLEAGANVYLEKPFTVNTAEADALMALAETRGLKLTVGHNLQFCSEALRMRELVRGGFLGGPPVHIESIQCFSHNDPVYGKALLGDRTHWVRKLPGSLLQNLISHGIARIVEFLSGDQFRISVQAFTSPALKKIGQEDVVDELCVIIRDTNDTTAYFTFSTRFGIAANELRIYGQTGNIIVDTMNRMVVPLRRTGYKSFLRYFLAPRVIGRAFIRNSGQNVRQFLRREFHEAGGMKNLFQAFYHSVAANAPLPIPYSEIRATSQIMDEIFAQLPKSGACTVDNSK
jgi:predicted dehydrogenase